jgi:hypothetical protein
MACDGTRGAPVKKILVSGLLAVTAAILLPGIAGASAISGSENIQITQVNNQPGAVFAQGVFNAGGTDYKKTNQTDLFVFSDGAFTVHHVTTSSPPPTFDPTTCMVTATQAGTFSLKGGVGAFKGVSGSGTFSASFMAAFPRKPNGACDLKRNAQPTASVSQISASGTVSFS